MKFRGFDPTNNRWHFVGYKMPEIVCTLIADDFFTCKTSQSTGLFDASNKEIYGGDILSDYTEHEGKLVKSYKQVYWDKELAAWCLDESFSQNKSMPAYLAAELKDFNYWITGNIYENPELIQKCSLQTTS